MKKKVDIILPCLNEETTLHERITSIQKVMNKLASKYKYNIVLCDNGSTDNSVNIAKKLNATVLIEEKKGYGAALLNGINNSEADYIVMLDCDLSYNEKDIPNFLDELDSGYELVVGNRFAGTIEKGAMPKSHRIGSRCLSIYANILFRSPCKDYHCGLRAFQREAILKCNLKSPGFEFASEMIVRARSKHLLIKEITTGLFIDGRDRKPHLKAIRDGLRHLFYITYCKIDTSKIFRYSLCLIVSLLLIGLIILCGYYSQNTRFENNYNKSIEFFNNTNNKYINKEDDINLLNDIKSTSSKSIKKFTISSSNSDLNSIMWNGENYIVRLIVMITPISNSFYIAFIIILLVIILLNFYKLFRISVSLSISYSICLILMLLNNFSFSITHLLSVLFISLLSLIIVLMYKHKYREFGILFAISGALSSFLTLTAFNLSVLIFPLILYIFLILVKEEYSINLFNYFFAWLVFYIMVILIKAGLTIMYFDINYVVDTIKNLYSNINIIDYFKMFIKTNIYSLNNIMPFNLLIHRTYLIIGIIFVLISLYAKKNFKLFYYSIIFIILMILFRNFILSSYSYCNYQILYKELYIILFYIIFVLCYILERRIAIYKLERYINK